MDASWARPAVSSASEASGRFARKLADDRLAKTPEGVSPSGIFAPYGGAELPGEFQQLGQTRLVSGFSCPSQGAMAISPGPSGSSRAGDVGAAGQVMHSAV